MIKHKTFIISLLLLLGLTVVSYQLDQNLAILSDMRVWLLFLSLVKFIIIFYFFMEMKTAHAFWKIFAWTYLAIVFVVMFSFY